MQGWSEDDAVGKALLFSRAKDPEIASMTWKEGMDDRVGCLLFGFGAHGPHEGNPDARIQVVRPRIR
jgi:hypothetical protein